MESPCFFEEMTQNMPIKVGAGAALYALPAFLPSTRPFYPALARGMGSVVVHVGVLDDNRRLRTRRDMLVFLVLVLGAVCAIVAWEARQEMYLALRSWDG